MNMQIFNSFSKRNLGFTLIEVVIVMLIIATLAGLAVPAYREYVLKARRSEARAAVMRIVNLEEHYLMDRGQYTVSLADLGLIGTTSINGFYDLSVTCVPADCVTAGVVPAAFTVTAAAQQTQQYDKCSSISYTSDPNSVVKWTATGDGLSAAQALSTCIPD